MAEDRKQPEGEKDAAAPAAKSGGLAAWLPLIVTITLMPAIAFGMTNFVLVPQLQKGLGIKDTAEGGASSKSKGGVAEKKTSVQLSKLLVNIAGTMGSRYLLVSVTVVGNGGEAFKAKMTENDAQLRDMAMGVLSVKTLADLEKPGSRNLVRTELINCFNNVLGENSVAEIYLTEFGIQ